MDKGWFDHNLQDDSLPKEDILKAIRGGIDDGKKIKQKQVLKKRVKWSGWASGIAASFVLASGFLFTPMNKVLADVPLLGKLYENFHFEIGKDLSQSHLVRQINQKASDNGVDITITSAYYDGNVIGVTFKAEGDNLSLEKMDKSPEIGYGMGGTDQDLQPSTGSELTKQKDGSYIGAMEYELRGGKKLPKNFTLPVNFTTIANVRGTWKFDVPVTQLPTKTIKLNVRGATKDGAHAININELMIGKATSSLRLTSTHPVDGMDETLNLKVLDNQGRRIALRGSEVLNIHENSATIKKDYEIQMGKIKQDADYLLVYPEVQRSEVSAKASLNQSLPVLVSSLNKDFKLTVNKIEQIDNRIIMDYTIENLSHLKLKEDRFNNFAESIHLIRTKNIIHSDDERSQYIELSSSEGSYIAGVDTKLLNVNIHQYQTTYDVNEVKGFNLNDYSIMAQFHFLTKDERIQMDPLKVELSK